MTSVLEVHSGGLLEIVNDERARGPGVSETAAADDQMSYVEQPLRDRSVERLKLDLAGAAGGQ